MQNKTILKSLSFIGAAISQGQMLHGVKKGPDIIRNSGIFQTLRNIYQIHAIHDYGNVSIELLSMMEQKLGERKHVVQNLRVLDPLLRVLNEKLREIHGRRNEGDVVLTVGGDHSIGSATINAALSANRNLKVLWVDAHPDFVNPQIKKTNSQNYHGLPLSHVTGAINLPGFTWLEQKLPYTSLVMIGIRDIDPDQFISLKKHGIKVYTMDHIIKYGIGEVITKSLHYLDPECKYPFHISFDLDVVDPYLVNQTGTLYRDGITHREACHIIRRVVNQRKLVSMDIAEINTEKGINVARPRFRDEQYFNDNVSQSVGVAVDLITSLCNQNLSL